MHYQSLALLAAAGLTSALTPPGFQPATQNQLFVQYGNQAALNGQVMPQQITQVQPTLSMSQRLSGTYAVIMVDIDIPTDSPPQTGTLLHWMQTGLTLSNQGTVLQSSNGGGSQQVFLLQNRQNAPALAEYFGPNPPAQVPLSHRYTFVLVDHSNISQQGLQVLTAAAQERFGFDTASVLQQAGLMQNVIAGNFFNVTNSGQASGPGIGNGTTGGLIPGGNQPGGGLVPGGNQPGAPLVPGSGTQPAGGLIPGSTGGLPGQTNTFNQPAASDIATAAGVIVSPKAGVVASLLLAAGIFLTF